MWCFLLLQAGWLVYMQITCFWSAALSKDSLNLLSGFPSLACTVVDHCEVQEFLLQPLVVLIWDDGAQSPAGSVAGWGGWQCSVCRQMWAPVWAGPKPALHWGMAMLVLSMLVWGLSQTQITAQLWVLSWILPRWGWACHGSAQRPAEQLNIQVSQTWQTCPQNLLAHPSRFLTINFHLASCILRSAVLSSAKINIVLHCECMLSAVQLSLLCREHNFISQSDVLNLLLGMFSEHGVVGGENPGVWFRICAISVSKNTHLTQSINSCLGSCVPLCCLLLSWALQYRTGWLRGAVKGDQEQK